MQKNLPPQYILEVIIDILNNSYFDLYFLKNFTQSFSKKELYEKIIQVIMQTARTGQIGDGKILVSELEEVYRIRTGDHGIDAVAEFI